MKLMLAGRSLKNITYCKAHSHDYWEIVIVANGEGVVVTKSEKVNFCFGTAYVMPPGMSHKVYSEKPFNDMFIHIDNLDFPENKITAITLSDEFYAIASQIINIYPKRHEGYSRTLNALTDSLVYLIKDSIGEKNRHPFTAGVRDFLSDNISNSLLGMKDISAFCGYDADYIRRAFKEDYGATPLEYLTFLRIDYSKKLLRNMKTYRISDVALLCGFSDPLYFSKTFKKHTGLSPKEYKKTGL